jgi:hypothetical protein
MAAPLELLAAHERRCPRCGAYLATERRDIERRVGDRRRSPPGDPGPPPGIGERRVAERRVGHRRRGAASGWEAR